MSPTFPTTPLVSVHLWGVRAAQVGAVMGQIGSHRRALRGLHGIRFAKQLGTASGDTFRWQDADLRHWGIVAAWDDEADARVFEQSSVVTSFDRRSFEKARFLLRPVSSRGSWSGSKPFEPTTNVAPSGPVAAITRARIRPRQWQSFYRSVPPVAAAASRAPGLRLRTGIGEAPLGYQGTFSLWDDNESLLAFAYGTAHRKAIRQTEKLGWYSEELFARFAVLHASGTFRGLGVELGTGL